MRTSEEIFALIDKVALFDERIRAVLLNGSRANPNAKPDIFQDFDIVYFVKDVSEFTNKPEWANQFGELMIMQMPETMQDPAPLDNGSFNYLMQFTDGNRIDLNVAPVSKITDFVTDSLSVVLLDKDALLPSLAAASEESHLPRVPTEKQFQDCCNEFYWLAPYVAKGLWRNDVGYYKHFLDTVMRGQLFKMLDWQIGVNHNFKKAPGKLGKNYEKLLQPKSFDLFLKTYASSDIAASWKALYAMTKLFELSAKEVADSFGFDFPDTEVKQVLAHLRHVEKIPKDAKTY